jgi:hypothetical protein
MKIMHGLISRACSPGRHRHHYFQLRLSMTKCVKPRGHLARLSARLSRSPIRTPHLDDLVLLVAKRLSGFTHFVKVKKGPACLNKLRMRAAPTPTNISMNSVPAHEKKGTPASPARHFASSVLPVPGLPCFRVPTHLPGLGFQV